jgi:hypothetical protein
MDQIQVIPAPDGCPGGKRHEGVGWCQIHPGRGERAQRSSHRVVKKHAWLTPSDALHEKGKLLTGHQMEGMGNGKKNIPIHVFGCG